MKLLLENWREYLNEITTLSTNLKQGLKKAVEGSQFWTQPNAEDDVDISDIPSDRDDELTTPAAQALMDALNQKAEELGTDLLFVITVSSEYILAPNDPFGGYPNNWLKHGQYSGPHGEKHVIWLELRPLHNNNYNLSELDPSVLVGIISRTINHELVHYEQLKKQAAAKGINDEEAWKQLLSDPKQIPQADKHTRAHYLSRHPEIDAYAHEAA